MPNWKKVVVSGSDATLNSLYTAGPIKVGGTVDPTFITVGDEGIHISPSTGQAVLRFTIGSATGSSAGAEIYYKTTGNDDLYLLNRASGSIVLGTNNQTSLTLTPSGDLYVTGSTNVFGGSTNPGAQIVVKNSNTSAGYLRFNDGTTLNSSPGFIKYDHADNSLALGTNTYSGLVLDTNRKLKLNAYGSGTVTGTSAYNLAVDSSGNVIETSTPTSTLEQVTTAGNTTGNNITITGSSADSLTLTNNSITISGSVSGPQYGKTHEIVYDTVNALYSSTTTITELPVPYVAGFTFDYVAFVSTSGGGASAGGLNVGRAGTVKGILRGTTGLFTKAFHITETTTLDLEDTYGTEGLTFTIVQDATGHSNQLVANTDSNWSYLINYTLTLYNNPTYS